MNKISIRFFLFTLVLVVVANLHAASTKIEIGNELDALLGENCSEQDEKKFAKRQMFCNEKIVGLNLLILDDYFVVSKSKKDGGKPNACIKKKPSVPDAALTKIYSENVSREIPAWARIYGVHYASQDSIVAVLKEIFLQSEGMADRNEIMISFPYQEKSIYDYKVFFNKLKKIGYTRIRLMAFQTEFGDKVYKKLQLKKYGGKEIKSWESVKNECNVDWLHVYDDALNYKIIKQIKHIDYDDDYLARYLIIDKTVKKYSELLKTIQKKFKDELFASRTEKHPDHPDARFQIKITLEFVVEPNGKVSASKVISSNSGNELFNTAVCDAVSQWNFEKIGLMCQKDT